MKQERNETTTTKKRKNPLQKNRKNTPATHTHTQILIRNYYLSRNTRAVNVFLVLVPVPVNICGKMQQNILPRALARQDICDAENVEVFKLPLSWEFRLNFANSLPHLLRHKENV